MRTLRFYFDYISSNAYLAWVRLPALAERFELQIEAVPVLFAGLLEANGQLGPAEIRPKATWMGRNCLRKAGQLGVRLRPPAFHPFNPLLPLRASSLDLEPTERNALITRLFEGTWADQLATSEPEVVERLAAEVGIPDPVALVQSASSPELKQRLHDQTDGAIARGVFGVPMFEVEGELFWGYDDLPYLELFLAGEDPLDPDEARLWGLEGSVRPSAMRRRFRDEPPPSWRRETPPAVGVRSTGASHEEDNGAKTREELIEEIQRVRRLLEEQLRSSAERMESDERLRLLSQISEQISDSLIATNLDYQVIYTNRAFQSLFGYEADDLLGDTPDPLIPDPGRREVRNDIYSTISAGRVWTGEVLNRRKDGSTFVCELTAFPLLGEEGTPLAYAAIQRDVSQRRQAQRRLRESEERYRSLFEAASDAIFTAEFTAQGARCVDCNRSALKMFGYTREEMIGLSPAELSPPVQPDGRQSKQVEEEIALAVLSGQPRRFEWKHCRRDGSQFHAEVAVNRMSIGGHAFMQATVRDVTERRKAEAELAGYRVRLEDLVTQRTEELERSREELRRTERLASVGTLAAGVAHQINNPLGAILNGAQLALLSEGDPDAKEVWKQTLENIIMQARRGGTIVRGILQFSREAPAEKRSGDISEVLTRACELTRSYAEEKGATIEAEGLRDSFRVLMSAIEIEQVFINLIRNGIESRPEGTRILLRAEPGSETVRIEVRDNGPGIGREAIKHIFDPFYTTRLIEGGTGLGLSVAHGIVVDHGGTISVESELGRGTSMIVELPLYVEE